MRRRLIERDDVMPISLAEVKAHLRVEHANDDAVIEALILSSVDGVSRDLNRALAEEVWEAYLDGFCHSIELPRVPLIGVTWIKYLDTDGNEQTLATSVYSVRGIGEDLAGEAVLAYQQSWPSTRGVPDAVTVRFSAGYQAGSGGSPGTWDGPNAVKAALLLIVAHRYEHREVGVVGTIWTDFPDAADLLEPLRVFQELSR